MLLAEERATLMCDGGTMCCDCGETHRKGVYVARAILGRSAVKTILTEDKTLEFVLLDPWGRCGIAFGLVGNCWSCWVEALIELKTRIYSALGVIDGIPAVRLTAG